MRLWVLRWVDDMHISDTYAPGTFDKYLLAPFTRRAYPFNNGTLNDAHGQLICAHVLPT